MEKEQINGEQNPTKKPASLQFYALIFFAAALFFVIAAAVLQQRSINNTQDVLDETKKTLLSNTSLLQNVQEQLASSEEKLNTLTAERNELVADMNSELSLIREQLEHSRGISDRMELFGFAQQAYINKDYKEAREFIGKITEIEVYFLPEMQEAYTSLEKKLKK